MYEEKYWCSCNFNIYTLNSKAGQQVESAFNSKCRLLTSYFGDISDCALIQSCLPMEGELRGALITFGIKKWIISSLLLST